MTVGILGRRYASALLALATEGNKVDKVSRDLRDFALGWKNSPELRAVFENPSVKVDARHQILRDLAESAGMDPLVRDTLLVVSDRGRLTHLPEIVDSFELLAEERSGSVRADVVTATDMPEGYFEELKKTLERVTGKKVVVTRKVDPSIIGGVVARIGDQIFDGSVKNQLSGLKDELLR
jgi:F-type H+-transporting ATPase subunit delta